MKNTDSSSISLTQGAKNFKEHYGQAWPLSAIINILAHYPEKLAEPLAWALARLHYDVSMQNPMTDYELNYYDELTVVLEALRR